MKNLIVIFIIGLFCLSCGKQETEISGEVFVATNSSENIKLGAVEISVITEKDIKPFIESKKNDSEIEKAKADYEKAKQKSSETLAKLQKIGKKYDEQNVSLERIKRSEDLYELSKGFEVLNDMKWSADDYDKTKLQADKDIVDAAACLERLNNLASPERYFTDMPEAITKTISNSDGKFSLKILEKGKYTIVAKTQRMIGTKTEFYYWLVWVEADGTSKTILLNNNNLTNSGSPDSLIKTTEYEA